MIAHRMPCFMQSTRSRCLSRLRGMRLRFVYQKLCFLRPNLSKYCLISTYRFRNVTHSFPSPAYTVHRRLYKSLTQLCTKMGGTCRKVLDEQLARYSVPLVLIAMRPKLALSCPTHPITNLLESSEPEPEAKPEALRNSTS